jgi:hypothetical protein
MTDSSAKTGSLACVAARADRLKERLIGAGAKACADEASIKATTGEAKSNFIAKVLFCLFCVFCV